MVPFTFMLLFILIFLLFSRISRLEKELDRLKKDIYAKKPDATPKAHQKSQKKQAPKAPTVTLKQEEKKTTIQNATKIDKPIIAKPIEKPDLVLPPVDELRMREVKWYVINEDNVDQVMAELDSQGIPVGLYALTGKGYANLGQNFSDIRAMIQQQQAIIVAYENYYKQAEEALDGAVKEE